MVALVVLVAAPVWSAAATTFDEVLEYYESVRLMLVADSMDTVNTNGAAIAKELRSLENDFTQARAGVSGEAATVVREDLDEMITAADAIAGASSLDAARDAFYELTKPLIRWRQGVSADGRPKVAYCPMYKRSWLQPGEEIGNPYGGMPRCGEIVAK
jgi:hypothetical protein